MPNFAKAFSPPPLIIPKELYQEFYEWCEESNIPKEELDRWDSRFNERQKQFLAERAEKYLAADKDRADPSKTQI
jgi:hexokinase